MLKKRYNKSFKRYIMSFKRHIMMFKRELFIVLLSFPLNIGKEICYFWLCFCSAFIV